MSSGPETTYAAWLGVTGISALTTAAFAWDRRSAPGALPLALLLLCISLWTLTYALHWLSAAPAEQAFWLDATFFGVSGAPVCVWLMTRAFTQPGVPLRPAAWSLLLAVPGVTWALLLGGDPGGMLFGSAATLQAHTRLGGGPWFTVVALHSYAMLGLSALRLAQFFRRASGIYRRQAGVLLAGLCLPWVVNVQSVLGEPPFPGLDLTPMLFLVTALVFLWGLLRFGLLDLVPVARHQLIEQMREGVVVLDRAERVVDLNAAAQQLVDRARPSPIGQPAAEVFEQWGAALASLGGLGERTTELTLGRLHLEVRVSPLRDRRGRVQGHVVVWRDVTTRRRAEAALRQAHEQLQLRMTEIERLQAELREQSVRDPLTGLHNRRYLEDALGAALGQARDEGGPFSVVLLDIDHFKRINDTLGHLGGDAVLRAVARYLRGAVTPDQTVCRYGGEEFVVVLPGLGAPAAAQRAEQWRRGIAALGTDHAHAAPVTVSVSLGLASYPAHGADPESVLLAADEALYRAKTLGRNQWQLAPEAVPAVLGARATGAEATPAAPD
ncbi:histidine kinase N-terminal 7TM domain-containing diguanylate cyclase [Deinococcus budaensis]|uniref:Diguanylate cyclase (GGDEF)-like protein n=1 Tax=Deinococcus budaensis TaxID=1665626 RepID=A0A7W8GDE2_9DEIO|nr:diguanylate cyclase [Deinococcus budaensis]MBB5233545.1 diguanylate cyclase (GGDEF)-like protein [Deinococcus budaensis]